MQYPSDIVVIGDGLIGAAIIAALQHPSLNILWVKPEKKPATPIPHYDRRVIALAEGSKQILSTIGVWAHLENHAIPIKHVQVSDRGHFGTVLIKAQDYSVAALGYIVPAYLLQQALDKVAHIAAIKPVYVQQIHHIKRQAGKIEINVQTEQGQQNLSAQLLIAADGAHSLIRELEAIKTNKAAKEQTALITEIRVDEPHNNTAYERFTTMGTIGLLPLEDKSYAVVWAVKNQYLPSLLAMNDQQFAEKLSHFLGYRLGKIVEVAARNIIPLSVIYAQEQIRPRLVLLGNAAHNLHPVAGQGFNLGLRDVAALAQLIVDAADRSMDLGAWQLLNKYFQLRQTDQQITANFSDFIVSIFTHDFLPVVTGRNLGLMAVDLMPGLKKMLARRAMGLI